MEIINAARNLFATRTKEVAAPAEPLNKEARKEGETYQQYGFRLAGLSQGSRHLLQPKLQAVYLGIKKEQQADAALQEALLQKQKTAIAEAEGKKKKTEEGLQETQKKIERIATDINDKNKEIEGLKTQNYTRNKEAWIQVWIAGILLVPFTLYLFVFYSSVAYSAFFEAFDSEQFADGDILSKALFDGQALSHAWEHGFFEMMFVLLMPVIFLAFGFILNRWETEKGKQKYLKIPAIISVAFIFDTLLAFTICSKIYAVEQLTVLSEKPSYNLGLAFQDPQFWTIICLGFVAYLVWGFTFGYWIKGISDLNLNEATRKHLERAIADLKTEQSAEQGNEKNLKNAITDLETQITSLKITLTDFTRYDLALIKLELSNFYSGWQQYLASLDKPQEEKDAAKAIYDGFLASISTEPTKI